MVSAELRDTVTGRWLPTLPMLRARRGHTATLLPDGRVLLAGGTDSVPTWSAELFDPATNRFTVTGAMNEARTGHRATLLPDGTVLLSGGIGADGSALASTEVYDPRLGRFVRGPRLNLPRARHAVAVLPGGIILALGGERVGLTGMRPLATVERLDPVTRQWVPAGAMTAPRAGHAAVVLPNGRLLVAGGSDAPPEVYDAALDRFTPLAVTGDTVTGTPVPVPGGLLFAGGPTPPARLDLATGRAVAIAGGAVAAALPTAPAVVSLPDGSVVLVGGTDASGAPSARVWRCTP